jgi:hypothetical protein
MKQVRLGLSFAAAALDGLFEQPAPIRCTVAIFVVLVIGLQSACSSAPRSFAPREPIPLSEFSSQYFDEVLHAHVKDGMVNYPAIAQDDRLQLFIWQLDRFNPNTLPSRQHSLAFWINAYNAFAMKGIIDGYSPQTVWGRYRYFIAYDYYVGGRPINLYNLERDLLIPDFRDPRIHFAIVCATRSCPKLASQVYSSDRLDEQLDDRARIFINDPTKNRFDRTQRIAYLSKIFEWFGQDFAAHSGSLLKYVAQYATDPEVARELNSGLYQVEFVDYDWTLNGIAYARRPR